MFSNLSLSAKLTGVSALVVAICLAIGIFLQSVVTSDITRRLTLEKAEELGRFHAEEVSKRLDEAMKVAEVLGAAFKGMRDSGQIAGRAAYDRMLEETLLQNPGLAGAWAGFEANALDGKDADYKDKDNPLHDPKTGRYVTYYYNYGDGVAPWHLTDIAGAEASGGDDEQYAYYNDPKRTKQPTVIDPVFYPDLGDGGVLLPSFAVPVMDNDGKFLGVAGVDIMLNAMAAEFGELRPFETGSVYAISYKGKWVAYPDEKLLGKLISEIDGSRQVFRDALPRIRKGETWTVDDGDFVRVFVPVTVPRTSTPWSVVVNIPKDKITEEADNLRLLTLIGGVLVVLIIVAALLFVGQILIRRPMQGTIGVINALQAGNYDVTVPEQDRGDEIGQVNSALEEFKQNAARVRQMEQEQVEAERRAEEDRKRARLQLADEFEASIGQIVASVSDSSGNMASAADDMSNVAEQSQSQAVTVAGAAEEASVNVQTVASSTEELSASINEISQQVAKSAQVASGAVEEANRTNKMVRELAGAADRIGEVVKLINDIAEQTNLLALNATIEAARAGEAGKGFAVVANEVKSLANQTAKATDEIVQQISAIQGETRNTVSAIGKIGETIESIHSIGTSIASAVEQQEAATREISNSVQQAASGTTEVSSNVEGMRGTAVTIGESASDVQTAAGGLAEQSRHLDEEVRSFVARIRSE